MTTTLKATLAAAALFTIATPLLGASAAYAAPAAPACKNGIAVNSYPPKTCKPPKPPKPIGGGGGGGIVAGNGGGGGGVIAGNGGGIVGGKLPFTGADILAMSVGGGVLVAAGGGALVAGRRRRSTQVA